MRPQNTLLPVAPLLRSRGRLLSLDSPVVMGILNCTPDSFWAGSRMQDADAVLRQADAMLQAGAVLLDLGGASTRPGAALSAPGDEARRVVPAIEAVARRFPEAWISVDTYHAAVAQEAVAAGAAVVNDVSGGALDGTMLASVAALDVPYVAMHMRGVPETMQRAPQYDDVVLDVFDALRQRLQDARKAGIGDVILDAGFGFGKTAAHNFRLLRRLADFRALGCPLLAGVSRKGMVWKTLGITPAEALNGTTALHMAALLNGASILRAHDVREAVETVRLFNHYQDA